MKKIIYAICMVALQVLFILTSHQMMSYAGLIKEKNLTVRLDNTAEELEYLNEKIEVYITRNGKYYLDIELNTSNEYNYRTALDKGYYKFFARVKYDQNEVYAIEVLNNELEINHTNSIKNNIVNIKIKNVDSADDFHFGVAEGPVESSILEYSADDMDKLKEVQKEWEEEMQKSIDALNAWEEENSFLTKFGTESDMGEAHYYPDTEDNVYEETRTSDEEKSTQMSQTKPAQTEAEETSKETLGNIRVGLAVIIIIIVISMALIWYLLWKMSGVKKDDA